jgi:hypothetical protein
MNVTVISFDSSERIEFERQSSCFNKVKSMKGIVMTLWMSLQVWCRLWPDVLSTKLDFNFGAPQKHCRSLGDDHHKAIGTNDIANVIGASCCSHLIRDMFPRIGFVVSFLLSDCFRFLCNFQYSVGIITSFCMLFPGDSYMVKCTLGAPFNGFGGMHQIINE